MSVVNQAAWGERADPRRTLAGAGQIPLGDHPRAGPLWTQQESCNALAQLADPASESRRPTGAMPTTSSIMIC